ncbi:MAG TPA: tetratricopeptide repeat protein, partial [Burkholderiales bacterium]|nr:tetratricopeptide repeat protein [Burkholderiales bacterium]
MYGLRDVERLLGLPRSTVRALVRAGFVRPARGARGALRFSFQDLIVLRQAQALAAARVPKHRIARAMKALRVQAESGQYSLAFEPVATVGELRRAAATPMDWFARGATLEGSDPQEALRAYRRAVEADAGFLDAYVNLGRLLHETGQLAKAERVYRDALEACGRAPLLLFNLGVLLEDLDRKPEAMDAYRGALRADPKLADGHYNLALLY